MSRIPKRNGKDIMFTWRDSLLFRESREEFLSVDGYFLIDKRARVSASFTEDNVLLENQVSIDVLPDECIFEIFRRLPGDLEKRVCACVSKRWLMLLCKIHRDEFRYSDWSTIVLENLHEIRLSVNKGLRSRHLEGEKATDVRLAAIAVGCSGLSRGLGKLVIRDSVSPSKMSNFGLTAISRGCLSLKVLLLCNVSSIGDQGLIDVANGCHMLEKLGLSHCPTLTDDALVAVSKACRQLTDLKIQSCVNIGNEGLKALGQHCSSLGSVAIIKCPLVQDQGIGNLISGESLALKKLRLKSLTITDMALAIIGHSGTSVTDLVLTDLPNVTKKGFWLMGNGEGLQKLTSLKVTLCPGATEPGIGSVGNGCPNLKQISLRKCEMLSDNGLVNLSSNAGALTSLEIKECHGITQLGVIDTISSRGEKLEALRILNCLGVQGETSGGCNYLPMDDTVGPPSFCLLKGMRSLSIQNCPGFGDGSLIIFAQLCPKLQKLEFTGCPGITDAGLIPLVESLREGLKKVYLNGCLNVTDKFVCALIKSHGWSLKKLSLKGSKSTDASLLAIADGCKCLTELDISNCGVTDFGIAALAQKLYLQDLSLSGCLMISDQSLPSLVKLGRGLNKLDIQHCNISRDSIGILKRRLRGCYILSCPPEGPSNSLFHSP